MSANTWDSKQVEKLIECIKSRPHIYNPKHLNHRNQCKRRLSYAEIAKEMSEIRPGTTVDEARKKWHSLRANYTTDRRKFENNNRPSSLFYYESMSFLAKHIQISMKPRTSRRKMLSPLDISVLNSANESPTTDPLKLGDSYDESSLDATVEEEESEKTPPALVTIFKSEPFDRREENCYPAEETFGPPNSKKWRTCLDNDQQSILGVLNNLASDVSKLVNRSEDLDGLFVSLLEARLRQMDENTKEEVKHKIELVLYEASQK